MKKSTPKYSPDSTYKVTIVKNNRERIPKYFRGEEMPEVELKIKNRIREIKYWFLEEIKHTKPDQRQTDSRTNESRFNEG